MVIWIIGLSGSGKTYLAKQILKKFKGKKIHIDGDEIRKYFTYNLGYTKKDRKKNSLFICDLCAYLEQKDYIVVCSILSIFNDHQLNNRKKFRKYFQIFIKTNITQLLKRNNKKIYSKAKNVVGNHIKFPTPVKNDMVIKNHFKPYDPKIIKKIIRKINNVK